MYKKNSSVEHKHRNKNNKIKYELISFLILEILKEKDFLIPFLYLKNLLN